MGVLGSLWLYISLSKGQVIMNKTNSLSVLDNGCTLLSSSFHTLKSELTWREDMRPSDQKGRNLPVRVTNPWDWEPQKVNAHREASVLSYVRGCWEEHSGRGQGSLWVKVRSPGSWWRICWLVGFFILQVVCGQSDIDTNYKFFFFLIVQFFLE